MTPWSHAIIITVACQSNEWERNSNLILFMINTVIIAEGLRRMDVLRKMRTWQIHARYVARIDTKTSHTKFFVTNNAYLAKMERKELSQISGPLSRRNDDSSKHLLTGWLWACTLLQAYVLLDVLKGLTVMMSIQVLVLFVYRDERKDRWKPAFGASSESNTHHF